MDLQKIVNDSLQLWEKYDLQAAEEELVQMEDRGKQDVMDKERWGYYQWLPCLIQLINPRVVVELGGAMGVSALMMMSELKKQKGHLYSITLEEHGLEFSFVKKDYPQLHKIVGDDFDLKVWPDSLVWKNVDIIFFDSDHTFEQIILETKTYLPLLSKGTICLFDDIHLNEGMEEFWNSLDKEKVDLTDKLHYSGFGLALI